MLVCKMAASQFIPSPGPLCTHYDQPGIIVPPTTSVEMTVPSSNASLSNSPCPECALHSTILQSMAFNTQTLENPGCHHLHASASCSSCYSSYQLQHQGGAPQGPHSHPALTSSRECHCGHIQQGYNPELYGQASATHAPVSGGMSYPNYQYQNWHQANLSNTGGAFHPSALDLPPPAGVGACYPNITANNILSLPSPSFSIPSISPYLENHQKTFELPDLITGINQLNSSFPPPGSMAEPAPVTQSDFPAPHATNETFHEITNAGKMNGGIDSLTGISAINISEPGGSDLKVDINENFEEGRKQQKTEKKKTKLMEKNSEVRKRQPEDLCQVCGDRASGYHYNALTCEGCKGFFRRSITNKTTYKQGCKNGGHCEMDTYTRRKCPHCRLKKCKEVGMLEECLLTEIQCQSKRRRRKAKQEQAEEVKPDETSQNECVASPAHSSMTSSPCGSDSSRNEDNTVSLTLTDEEKSIIDCVSEAFKYYKINPEIVRRWEKYINKESTKSCKFSDITTVHVQVLVEYTKSLPGFLSLDPEDQIALLKGSVFEAMLLRNSCGYHHLTRKINMEAIIDETGTEASKMEALIDFFSCIGRLGMDEKEYALLIAIVVFNSDYAYVKNKAAVEEYQDLYLSALAKYSITREPRRPSIFAKILAALTEIRSLSHFNAEIVTSWKKRGALTPLLCEIWDLE